jgi:hypothetical protein
MSRQENGRDVQKGIKFQRQRRQENGWVVASSSHCWCWVVVFSRSRFFAQWPHISQKCICRQVIITEILICHIRISLDFGEFLMRARVLLAGSCFAYFGYKFQGGKNRKIVAKKGPRSKSFGLYSSSCKSTYDFILFDLQFLTFLPYYAQCTNEGVGEADYN